MFGIASPCSATATTTCKNRASVASEGLRRERRAHLLGGSLSSLVLSGGSWHSSKRVQQSHNIKGLGAVGRRSRHEAKIEYRAQGEAAGALGKLSEAGQARRNRRPGHGQCAGACIADRPGLARRRPVQSAIAIDGGRRGWTSFHCPTTPSPPRCSMHEAKAIDVAWSTAADIAAAVAAGRRSAASIVEASARPHPWRDPQLNAFTVVTEERALARARAIDEARARGVTRCRPLAGVPFAVKNLFDIAGLPTLAGSKINRDAPPAAARCDADRAARSGRRHAGRRAQHGRIRLRLHRRERALRAVAQSARSQRA